MERTGRCLCGAVTFVARDVESKVSACHCGMCRRWTGGPLFVVGNAGVTWTGEEHIKTFTSSQWAERGFCSQCGTALFYRLTAPGPHQGAVQLAFGALDEQSGFELEKEWFIDRKPDLYALAGERTQLTEAQVFEMFGGG